MDVEFSAQLPAIWEFDADTPFGVEWLLKTGDWNDSGKWEDANIWID